MSVPTLSGGEGNIFAGWTSVHVSPSLDDLPGFHSLDVLYSSPASVILVPFLLPITLPIFQFSLSELLQFSPKEGPFQLYRQEQYRMCQRKEVYTCQSSQWLFLLGVGTCKEFRPARYKGPALWKRERGS